jgi:hypothetical protein
MLGLQACVTIPGLKKYFYLTKIEDDWLNVKKNFLCNLGWPGSHDKS